MPRRPQLVHRTQARLASSRVARTARVLTLAAAVAGLWPASAPIQAQAVLRLGLTVNDAALGPGETLRLGVSVDNPGGGPSADFFFLILLPDGTTVVSAGPGVGARFGTVGNVRTFVPVARGVSLAGAFPYAADPFFSYTFGGGEPLGTYRFFLVATRSGAFNDGRIDGGDLLAVANQDVTFALGPSVTVDTSRTASGTVTPAAGGTVQTTAANGTQLALTVPAGGVGESTSISIAPLTGVSHLDAGPFVAGVKATPSGLTFQTAATLTITLPPGFTVPSFGLRGFVMDDDGGDLQFVPVHLAGNVATIVVPHFSAAGVFVNDDWFRWGCTRQRHLPTLEQSVACATIRPLFVAEVQRLAAAGGGPVDLVFKFDVSAALQRWMEDGLLPRAAAAQTPEAVNTFALAQQVTEEWYSWISLWHVWGEPLTDRGNQAAGRVLGNLIDQFQEQYWRALYAAQQAGNAKCLTSRAAVDLFVSSVGRLTDYWTGQGLPSVPWTREFCVDLAIDAAPPPVLTSQSSAPMPVTIRLKFSDGIEVSATPERRAQVTITATNARVAPAGGALALPIDQQVMITPNAGETSSVVTISASLPEGAMRYLPVRTRTFTAGNGQVNLPVTQSLLWAATDMFLPGWSSHWRRVDSSTAFTVAARAEANQPSTAVTVAQGTFTGQNHSSSIRSVASTGSQTDVTASGRLEPALAIQPVFGVGRSQVAEVTARTSQFVCFNLPTPYVVTYNAQTSAPGMGTFELRIGGTLVQSPGSVTVGAGERCVHLVAAITCSNRANWSTVGCQAPTPVTWSYSATLRPAP